jgi:hypothetical protein
MGSTSERTNEMTTTDELVGRYVAVWSEKDDDTRGEMVAELWADDAVHVIGSREVKGHADIEARVGDSYRDLVEEKGFAFELNGDVAAHHDAVTFEIHMAPSNGGPVVWVGRMFLLLDVAGRIRRDYQFGRYVAA